jgi:hypothetical protein
MCLKVKPRKLRRRWPSWGCRAIEKKNSIPNMQHLHTSHPPPKKKRKVRERRGIDPSIFTFGARLRLVATFTSGRWVPGNPFGQAGWISQLVCELRIREELCPCPTSNIYSPTVQQPINYIDWDLRKSEITFLSNASPISERALSFWEVYKLRPFVLLGRATSRRKCLWGIGGMIMAAENRSTRTNPCPSANFFHQKSYTDWPGIKPRPLRPEAED